MNNKGNHSKGNGSHGKPTFTDRLAVRIANLAIHHPWKVLAAVMLVVALTAAGAGNLQFANNYRIFFGPDNPELLAELRLDVLPQRIGPIQGLPPLPRQ